MYVFCVADIPALVPWQPADDGDHPDRDELSPWHRRRTGRRSIHHHHPSPPKMPMVFEVLEKCTKVLTPAIYHDLNPSKLGETSFANGFDVLPRSLTSMKTQHMHFTNRKIRNSVQSTTKGYDQEHDWNGNRLSPLKKSHEKRRIILQKMPLKNYAG